MQQIAKDENAEERIKEDQSMKCTVEEFINKILDQCREVMERHKSYSSEDYARAGVYRRLEKELADIKVGQMLLFRMKKSFGNYQRLIETRKFTVFCLP